MSNEFDRSEETGKPKVPVIKVLNSSKLSVKVLYCAEKVFLGTAPCMYPLLQSTVTFFKVDIYIQYIFTICSPYVHYMFTIH